MKAKERLWWNADRSKLLPEGHKDAALLYAAPGDEIPESAAKKYRLVDGYLRGGAAAKAAKGESEQDANGEEKEGAKGEDKQGAKGGDKQSGAGLTIKKAKKAKKAKKE